jgi:HK97 family phage major capsid protein
MNMEEILALLEALLANPNATPEEMAATLAQVRDALLALTQTPAEDNTDGGGVSVASAEQIIAVGEKVAKLEGIRLKKLEARNAIKSLQNSDWTTPVNRIPTGTKTGTQVTVKSRHTSKHFKSNEDAYKVGRFLQAMTGNNQAAQWCQDNGIGFKTLTEGNELSAGILVPEVWEDAIWNLKEPRGVARQYANVVPMNGPVTKKIKYTGGAQTFFVGEGVAPTASDLTYSLSVLSAKKLGHLQYLTYELAEDSLVNAVDLITAEAAYALSDKEDQCMFVGDGTSTYGGVIGLRYAYQKLVEDAGGTWTNDTHKAYLSSAIVNPTNAWSGVTRDVLTSLRGKVRTNNPTGTMAYHCNSAFYYGVMLPLAYAAGGTTATEIVNGAPVERYDGYPVVFVETMASESTANDIPVYFGSLATAADFGDLKSTTVETDKNIRTQIWEVVTTERFDINVHDVGNYNATATNRKRGGLSALITKN